MNTLLALLVTLHPVVVPGPALDQMCMNPAYVHMHEQECKQANFPPYYSD